MYIGLLKVGSRPPFHPDTYTGYGQQVQFGNYWGSHVNLLGKEIPKMNAEMKKTKMKTANQPTDFM
jgi:hypothetical protein